MAQVKVCEAQSFEFCSVKINLNETWFIVQEFDQSGNHRLRFGADCSQWAAYQHIASLQLRTIGQFYGTSKYWQNVLPRVFQKIDPLVIP